MKPIQLSYLVSVLIYVTVGCEVNSNKILEFIRNFLIVLLKICIFLMKHNRFYVRVASKG